MKKIHYYSIFQNYSLHSLGRGGDRGRAALGREPALRLPLPQVREPDREAREEARLGADARGPAARPRARLRRARLRGGGHISKISKTNNFILQNFANFWRARSRLYQNELLQVNMRLIAFFKLYKMCTLLHRSKFNILAKIYKKPCIFSCHFCNICKLC